MIFQTVKPEEDDARRKEITLLLAADNLDDDSQMDVALHGELAGKIVDQIFERASKGSRRTISKLFPGCTFPWEGSTSQVENYLNELHLLLLRE